MALALKKYTLVPTAEGTLDPRYPDGNQAPIAPVLDAVVEVSAVQFDVVLDTPSTGGVAPLSYTLERSQTSASAGFSVISTNAFSVASDTYQDAGLTAVTQYWYRAYSIDSNTIPRQSGYSNVVSGITQAVSGDVTAPSIPEWVATTGTPIVTTTTIKLHWEASTDT